MILLKEKTGRGCLTNHLVVAGVGEAVPFPDFNDKTKSFLTSHMVHRIPSLSVTQSKEPSSICMLWTSTLEKIVNTPGYPSPLPKTRLPDLFTIKSNMGLGVFAKRDIKASACIGRKAVARTRAHDFLLP